MKFFVLKKAQMDLRKIVQYYADQQHVDLGNKTVEYLLQQIEDLAENYEQFALGEIVSMKNDIKRYHIRKKS